MYNLLIAAGAALLSFGAVWAWLGPIAAIVPALGVFIGAVFLLTRRTGQLVSAELAAVPVLLQQRRIDEAETKLVHVKERFGRWQLLLAGQIDAQLGIIDYLQRKFDSAVPKLEAGAWRNGPVLACLGAIDWRRKNKDAAWKRFEAATKASSEDAMIWIVYATLRAREDQRAEALEVLARAVKALPNNAMLKDLQGRIANKQKIDPGRFGEGWYQYFPEDLAQHLATRGMRGGPLLPGMPQPPQQPRFGAKNAPRR